MAFNERSLDDYIDVAERMTEFYDRYPAGSLRMAEPWQQAIIEGFDKNGERVAQTFIVYTAAAYRQPDDPAPGIGVAWEVFPGRTSFTRGSEIMNAETSAWGRAMAALGIATKRGIASRQEVQARRAERDDGLPVNRDGSLSRSRTTDAEKDAAGVMTSAQHAEHTALQPKAGELGPVTRLRAVPADDPFYDTAAPPDPDQRDYGSPGTVTPAQLRRMHALYKRAFPGRTDEQRHADTAIALGLTELASWSVLSHEQADVVIGRLEAKTEAKT